ncbi:polymorphic toxin-type HINT domain-containing protein [Planctomycetota bacterium]
MTFHRLNKPNSDHAVPRFKSGLAYWLCVVIAIAALSPRIVQLLGCTSVVAASSNANTSISRAVVQEPRLATKPIEEIRCGDRIPSELPEGLQPDDEPEPDPETWRLVELEVEKADGSRVEVNLLRPLKWLQNSGALEHGTFSLNVEELDIDGEAAILKILPCPRIQTGDGQVVTGTFRHSSDSLVELHIEGEPVPIISTIGHPVWSEDRQDFVAAVDLQANERLKSINGETIRFVRARQLPVSLRDVFNFEVNSSHVYAVGSQGITVHNAKFKDCNQWASNRQKQHKKQGKPSEKFKIQGEGETKFKLPGWEGENEGPFNYHYMLFRDGKVFDQANGRGIAASKWWAQLLKLNPGIEKVISIPEGIFD